MSIEKTGAAQAKTTKRNGSVGTLVCVGTLVVRADICGPMAAATGISTTLVQKPERSLDYITNPRPLGISATLVQKLEGSLDYGLLDETKCSPCCGSRCDRCGSSCCGGLI